MIWRIKRKATGETIGYYGGENGTVARDRCAADVHASPDSLFASLVLFPLRLTVDTPVATQEDKQNDE